MDSQKSSKKPKNSRYHYIQINTISGELQCLKCGITSPFRAWLPLTMRMASAVSKAFKQDHMYCRQSEAGTALQESNLVAYNKWVEEHGKKPGVEMVFG